MPHIYNLAVGDVLRGLSDKEAFADETLAINAEYKQEDLDVNPVLRVRGLVAAVSVHKGCLHRQHVLLMFNHVRFAPPHNAKRHFAIFSLPNRHPSLERSTSLFWTCVPAGQARISCLNGP